MSKEEEHPRKNPPTVTRLPGIYIHGASRTLNEAGGLGVKEHQRGRFQTAVEIYDLILAKIPDHASTHFNRALALQNMGRLEEAVEGYSRSLTFQPDNPQVYNNRAAVLFQLNHHEAALTDSDKAIALQPNSAIIHNNRGNALNMLKRYDEALEAYGRAIALKPDYALAYYNRGHVFLSKGSMPEAEMMLRRALALKPDFSDPWILLTRMREYRGLDEADLKNIEMLLGRPGISPRDTEYLHFAVGKIQDDRGNYDAAFESYRLANEIHNATFPYEAAKTTEMTNRIMAVFDQESLGRHFAFASQSRLPLFVVGMPRSGTTLMASILSKHPAIATAGELGTIGKLASSLSGTDNSSYPEAAKSLSPSAAGKLTEEYENRLRRDAKAGARYVIDKHPLNFKHLGFLNVLFPQSRIIHCTRHPLDTGLSNYFQQFSGHYAYASDLRNIGHFYLEYARLMEHWRKFPAINMIEVGYEDMVLKTEETARRVVDWLGLEWDASCLAPESNQSPVETFSQWQVRQPIYTQSVGRWKHYDSHLGGLKEVLGCGGSDQ